MRLLPAVVVLALGCGVGRKGPSPEIERGVARGANIILVTLDTTRADRLGAYGYEHATTPVLDRLADEGVRFDNAISPAPLTLPAHVSLFTGLDPPSHEVHANGLYRLDEAKTTLAETLRAEGYDTGAFVSAFVLDTRYGLSQGFDVFDDRVTPLADQAFGGLDSQRTAKDVTDAALEWLDDRGGERPIFLWTHYYDPHAPYLPPEDFAQDYDGEIAHVDSQLGRLIEAVVSASRSSIVVIAGDHGESLGEHGEPTHSRLIYDATQRVPLIFWAPDYLAPHVVTDLAGLIDVVPSLLYLMDVEPTNPTDGVNLFAGQTSSDRTIYMETLATYLDNGWAPLFGLRSQTAKLILAPTPELYDVSRDPDESKNLYHSADGADAEARARLESILSDRLANMPSFTEVAASARQLDSRELSRLQALGYLGGGGSQRASGDGLPDPKEMMSLLKLLAQAEEARRAGRFDEALEKAERAYRGAPEDLQVLQELGILYAQTGRFDEAERVFTSYLERKPSANVSVLLANVLRELGRAGEGRAVAQRALEREPDHGGVLITLGDFAVAQGEFQDALRLYQQAKTVDPYRASSTANRRIIELRSR